MGPFQLHNTWAGVLYDGKTMYETTKYQITDIVDRVGGGDSLWGSDLWVVKIPEMINMHLILLWQRHA